MKIDILTLFPEMFDSLKSSIIGKAQQTGKISINAIDIREYSADKHKKCDDYPYGGGAGMVMTPQPIHDCINSIDAARSALRIYLSPKGKTLDQQLVKQLSSNQHIVLLCGHYEGIDQRVLDVDIDMEISIGDYVLTGGELPAMVLVDAICRYLPDVLHSAESTDEESFSNNTLEYPHYTRPPEWNGLQVPEVLISGNHENIKKWRKVKELEVTTKNRPDLLNKE